MTKTNTKFMSDFDIEVANKSISQSEAAILYESILLAGLHNFEIKDINKLLNKLQKIMESE